jgi:hypothetical protein
MIRLVLSGLGVFLALMSFGQNIVRLEYFIDTDPGHGNGISVPFTPGATLTDLTFDVPVASIDPGVHNIYFRMQDDAFTWGQTFSRVIYKEAFVLGDALPNIVKAEYFVDTDPGFGNGTDVPLTPGTTLTDFSFTIPLGALSQGVHVTSVRFKNEEGAWSHTFSNVIFKEDILLGDDAPDIVEAEYFIDTDPGFGAGISIPLTPGATLTDLSFTVDLDGVSTGVHVVYTRLKSANKSWSHTHPTVIFKEAITGNDAAPDIVKAEYFIDTDPGFGNATNIPLTANETLTDFTFSIPLGSVSNGAHVVYTRMKSSSNTWSATHSSVFFKESISGLTAPDITRLEYFVDTDPGFGNGTDVPVTPGSVLTDIAFAIDASTLVDGAHKVYIRAKDANNSWGVVLVKDFSVCDHPGTTLNPAANITSTGFELSWAAVPGSSNYQLDVSADNFNTFVGLYNAVSIPSNTTTVNGVPHATNYKVRVRAVAGCASVHSNVIEVTTPLSPPNSQPSSLTFSFVTASSYTVQYPAASGPPTGYLVVRKVGSSPAFVPQLNEVYTIGQVLSDGVVAYFGPDLTFIESGLTSNTEYFYDVFAYNQAFGLTAYRTTSPRENSVRTVALQPDAQPTNLTFSTVTDTGYTVEFTPSAGGADGYIAIRATGTAPVAAPVDGTTYTTTMGTNTVVYQGSAPTFTQTGLTSNTNYYYAIFAYNGAGVGINYFELTPLTGFVTTPISPPTSQPTNLSFTNVNTSSFDVSFTATSADGYLVIRKTGGSPAFAPQTNVAYTLNQDTGDGIVAYVGPGTSFSESSLEPETTYHYDVFAYNEEGLLIGYRGFSPLEGSVSTLVEEPTAPATGLTLSGITTSSIQLDFVPSASSTASLVLRSTGAESSFLPVDGTPYAVDEVVSDVTVVFSGAGDSFIDDGLSSGIVYHYRVFAFNGAGAASSYLATVEAGNSASTITLCDQPVLLAADPVSQLEFTINWSAVTGAASYQVDVSGDNFVTMLAGFDNATASTNSLNVTGLQPGVEYKYRVRAVNASGVSVNSDEGMQITVPATPEVLDVTAVGLTQFTVNWNAVTGADDYRIDVSSDNFTTFLTGFENKSVATTSEPVTGLTAGTAYQYRIRSVNEAGTSPNSEPAEQFTLPAAPGVLDASQINSTNFKANWSAVDDVTEYRLDVTLSSNNFNPSLPEYTDLPVIGSLGKIVTGVSPTTEYTYRVRAVNAAGSSPNSLTASLTTLAPGAGLNFTLTVPEEFTTETVKVTVVIGNGVGPYTYTIFHRKISEETYQSETSGEISNDSFEFTLTQAMADELGLQFYVHVVNAAGADRNSQPAFIRKIVPAAGIRIPFEKSGGTLSSYEIFSIPYKLTDDNIDNIFEELGAYEKHRWRLVRYQGGKNVDYGDGFNKIELGKSYWFNSKEPANITFTGGTTALVGNDAPFLMTLEPGWNQIGSPFPFNVDWDDILGLTENSAVASSVDGSITTYNATSMLLNGSTVDLETGRGGFVHNDQSSSITLSLPVSLKGSYSPGRKKSPRSIDSSILDNDKWLVPITANIGGNSSEVTAIGMHPDAIASKDMYDGLVVPRFVNYVELYTYHNEFFTPKFSKDVMPTGLQGSWDLTFESNVESESVDLYWPAGDLGQGSAKLFLVDLTAGRWIDMKTSSSYTFKPNGPHKFRIAFAADEEHLDLAVNMMGVPYPNPFTDQVTIPFAVHKAPAQISIVVYDAMGRRITDLVNAQFEKGIHEVTWDGNAPGGSPVPSGMYFCRMMGDAMIMTERIIKK